MTFRERQPKSKGRCLISALSWTLAVAIWFLLAIMQLMSLLEFFGIKTMILTVLTLAAAMASVIYCRSSWQQWKTFENPKSDKQEEDDHE